MKPDWKDAPEWAQWLARDKHGDWFWYENRPYDSSSVFNSDGGRMTCASVVDDWRETLEQRPE